MRESARRRGRGRDKDLPADMLSMQRGCISTVNVILRGRRAASSTRCTVVVIVVTQNGKPTLSYIIFSVSSVVIARASVSFLVHIGSFVNASTEHFVIARSAIRISRRRGFEADNQRHNEREAFEKKKKTEKRKIPDARNRAIFEQAAFINHDSSFL